MGMLRRLREWREKRDGTLEGPALHTETLHTEERFTIRWDPNGETNLQTVVDNAPENSRIVGHLETEVEIDDEIVVSTDGLELSYLNLTLADGANSAIINIQADGVTVKHCDLDGNRENQTGANPEGGLYVDFEKHRENILIEKCWVYHTHDSAISAGNDKVDASEPEWVENVTVRDCLVWDFGDDGITYHRVDGGLVENCYAWGAHQQDGAGTTYGYEHEWGTRNVVTRDCHYLGSPEVGSEGGGFLVKGGGDDVEGNATECVFENCYTSGVTHNDFYAVANEDVGDRPTVTFRDCHAQGTDGFAQMRIAGYEGHVEGGRLTGTDTTRSIEVRDEGNFNGYAHIGRIWTERRNEIKSTDGAVVDGLVMRNASSLEVLEGAGKTVVKFADFNGTGLDIEDNGTGPVHLHDLHDISGITLDGDVEVVSHSPTITELDYDDGRVGAEFDARTTYTQIAEITSDDVDENNEYIFDPLPNYGTLIKTSDLREQFDVRFTDADNSGDYHYRADQMDTNDDWRPGEDELRVSRSTTDGVGGTWELLHLRAGRPGLAERSSVEPDETVRILSRGYYDGGPDKLRLIFDSDSFVGTVTVHEPLQSNTDIS